MFLIGQDSNNFSFTLGVLKFLGTKNDKFQFAKKQFGDGD
jgi:hypothetical protein